MTANANAKADAPTVRLTIPARAEYISLCRLALTGIGRLRQSAQNAGRAAGREKFILYPAPGVTRLQLLWNRFHSVPTPTNRLLQASSITQPARG